MVDWPANDIIITHLSIKKKFKQINFIRIHSPMASIQNMRAKYIYQAYDFPQNSTTLGENFNDGFEKHRRRHLK